MLCIGKLKQFYVIINYFYHNYNKNCFPEYWTSPLNHLLILSTFAPDSIELIVKVKVPRYRPGCFPEAGRGIALLFQDLGARRTRYPLYRRLGGLQGRSGRAKNLVPTGIRSPDRPARSQSLYRLSYLAHIELILFFVYLWNARRRLLIVYKFASFYKFSTRFHFGAQHFIKPVLC